MTLPSIFYPGDWFVNPVFCWFPLVSLDHSPVLSVLFGFYLVVLAARPHKRLLHSNTGRNDPIMAIYLGKLPTELCEEKHFTRQKKTTHW